MARSFNGSTDRIDYANPWNPQGSALTFAAWVYVITVQNGYVTHIGLGDDTYGMGIYARYDQELRFWRGGATNKLRDSGDTFATGQWQHWLVTDTADFGTATAIRIYFNGSEVSYSGGSVQNGVTEDSFTGKATVGGRIEDDNRCFDGYICEVAHWDRVLNAGEIAALGAGYSPRFFMNGIKTYCPLVRATFDRVTGDYGTLDGTAVVAHPRIIYPVPAVVGLPAVLAADAMPMAMDQYRRMRMT